LPLVEDFFQELDASWMEPQAEKIELSIIGSGALMLQCAYERGTKDSDVFETTSLTSDIQTKLLALAGNGTILHTRRRMYIDIVRNGVPFLPAGPSWHSVMRLSALRNFAVRALDITDVVVSKLKRFNGNDIADIQAMLDRDLVAHSMLLDRFRSAFQEFSYEARASSLAGYVDNLHRVERDMFNVAETDFSAELECLRY
jgi:hypothetical protein